MDDAALMRRALRLAERGRGGTSPNPMVGATVVVADGTIAGDGWHRRAGGPHAEVFALEAAGDLARGATLYCTLEPCCHHGRTGPCTDRVIAAGIRRVVAAVEDPNPMVAGGGLRRLREHGIEVTSGVEADRARRLNAPFFTFIREGRPFVILKAGVSLDGRIAAAPGVRTAITSPASLTRVQRTRAEVDAIAVGSGTMLADDPLLTARDVVRARPLVRAIFDRRLRTPPGARIFGTLDAGPVLILTTREEATARPDRAAALRAAGADLVTPDDGSVGTALRALALRGVLTILLEGGAALHAAAWDAGMIDAVQVYVAPQTIGPDGLPLLEGRALGLPLLADARLVLSGPDVLLEGYVHRPR